jgi:hypothetical protein
MPLQTRTLTVTTLKPDGTALGRLYVEAELTKADYTADGQVVPELVRVATNAQGVALLSLFPNDLGMTGSQYIVRTVRQLGPARQVLHEEPAITMPDADARIETLVGSSPQDPSFASGAAISAAAAAEDALEVAADRQAVEQLAQQVADDRTAVAQDLLATDEDQQQVAADRQAVEQLSQQVTDDRGAVAQDLLATDEDQQQVAADRQAVEQLAQQVTDDRAAVAQDLLATDEDQQQVAADRQFVETNLANALFVLEQDGGRLRVATGTGYTPTIVTQADGIRTVRLTLPE